jgi:hypothetical protein
MVDGVDGLQQTPRLIAAAKFNVAALKKLQKAFEDDPEADLSTHFPLSYSTLVFPGSD